MTQPAPEPRAKPLQAWIGALESVAAMAGDPRLTLAGMLDRLAAEHGDRPALVGDVEMLTYADLARRADAVARWAACHHPGATIGLLLPNSPDYVALWLGLTRAGCIVALLNTNLVGAALQHAIQAGGCQLVIADDDHAGRIAETPVVAPAQIAHRDHTPLPLPPLPEPGAIALLVYTSGTTGLPKAARISHGRVLEWSLWFAGMMQIRPDDRLYDCLPLYHSTGGIVAIGASLVRGASVLIARSFSASRFWDDVVGGRCTIFFYIGELCRYLLASPPHPREGEHVLRLACGNGLQAPVWEGVQQRFAIPQILEFYAATEGSVSLYNCEGRPGAIGRVPPFLQARFPLAIVRIDPDTGAPLRGEDGLCLSCGPDEPGEALGRVDAAAGTPARRFDGYTDAAAASRKLLDDVLARGDRWFRSGDLMRRDAAGFIYFVDRLGDTFRWKGENVATGEVALQVRAAPGVIDAVVFGVRVAGHEGRAGMTALVPAASFDPAVLWAHLAATLPTYAQPVFVRLCAALDLTGTFKLAATRFAQEGYDRSSDPVLVADRARATYIELDPERRAAIERGERRL